MCDDKGMGAEYRARLAQYKAEVHHRMLKAVVLEDQTEFEELYEMALNLEEKGLSGYAAEQLRAEGL